MNKILEAEAEAGEVTLGGVSVPDASILTDGARKSKGLIFISESGVVYVGFPIDDIKELVDITTKLKDISNLIAAVPSVIGQTPAQANPAILTSITELEAQLAAFKVS